VSAHPALIALLKTHAPAATGDLAWLDGAMPLRVSAFIGPADLPLDLITSVRCIVHVGDRIVLCANKDGVHPVPGGRREPGETLADTAVREVHEETGWRLERASMRPLGWLHLRQLGPPVAGNRGPYPDFLQLVFHGTATERDGGPDVAWTDLDGYEQSSELVSVAEARARTSNVLLVHTFLDLLSRTT
jgi:ADP-ribose pyrophosphatase YjhB (NUDIX family)